MDDIELQINIPADNDGYILLKCPLCKSLFKLRADEMQNDDVIDWFCPICGFKSNDTYLTEDVINLAMTKIENEVMDKIHKEFNRIERRANNSLVTFKSGNKPKEKVEIPLIAGIKDLEIKEYFCCKRHSKISPINKITGSYCPYCGVRHD